ncbi:MAG: hypothetical protein EB084_10850 [Proteobacteria bacterium]|nr:hypothetical protein [Pseudomonadota bacterium]
MTTQLLQHRYTAGQSLVYDQQVSLLIERPGVDPVADLGAVSCTVTVIEVDADGAATLELVHRVEEQMTLRPLLTAETTRCRVTPRGEVLSATPRPPLLPFVAFPDGQLTLKESWSSVESSGPKRLSMDHTLAVLEPVGDDVYAHVASEGSAAGDPAIEMYATRVFSVRLGHLVVGRTVLKYIGSAGDVSTLVVEEKVRDL